MARDEITVHIPALTEKQSLEVANITKTSVTQANGIKIKNALDNKNNSLVIVIEPSTAAAVTIKASDNYPNRILGDATLGAVAVPASKPTAILLEDISRFENRDGSINIDFGSGFVGYIYAVAKRAGLKPVA